MNAVVVLVAVVVAVVVRLDSGTLAAKVVGVVDPADLQLVGLNLP
jgi:hypothetical protein